MGLDITCIFELIHAFCVCFVSYCILSRICQTVHHTFHIITSRLHSVLSFQTVLAVSVKTLDATMRWSLKKLSTICLKLLSVIDNYSMHGSTLVLVSGDCLFNGIVIGVVVVWNYSGYF